MITYTQYASRTGRVIQQLTLPENTDYYDANSVLLYEGSIDGGTHYIVDGQPAERPLMDIVMSKSVILANGEDTSTIAGIPAGAKLHVSGPVSLDPVTVDETAIQFSADVPGDYSLRIECFPYLDWTEVIHAD